MLVLWRNAGDDSRRVWLQLSAHLLIPSDVRIAELRNPRNGSRGMEQFESGRAVVSNEQQVMALKILMFSALKQTYRRGKVTQELADVVAAVSSGDAGAIQATIAELGPDFAAACADVEGQS